MRALRNAAIVAGMVLLTFLVILGITHEGRVAIQTALLIPEVLPQVEWRPLRAISTPPLIEQVEYPFAGGRGQATVFRPRDGNRHGAIILFLGINPDLEDATLHRLAEGLAREGIAVMLPRPVELLQGRVSYQEVESLIGAFRFLKEEPYADPKRIGYGGFCVGSSLSLLAAADPRISSEVRFVNFFGGYFSAADLLLAMTTRRLYLDGQSEPWEPNRDALNWFSQQLTLNVSTSDGRDAVDRVLANRDPERAPALYEALPEEMKVHFRRLSPNTALDWLQAKLFVMHDRNDTYVPYVESERLVAALEDYPRKHYTRFDLFQHMHPQRQLAPLAFIQEVGKLYYHLYLLMLELA